MPGLADRASVEAFLCAHEPILEPTFYAAGEDVGVWRIVSFLGRGGNGEVYRVVHRQLDLVAALKVLVRDDSASRDRFRREARILAEHSHPAFPRFLGYDENKESTYLVIELLEAMPLPTTDHKVARYLRKVCEGVAFLHDLGLVHRDIKPQNILQRGHSGQPVLIDLGLVKDTTLSPAHAGVSLSIVNGKVLGVGTPKYAAPEQFAGGVISPAADIHALGMLANECFSGNPPKAWERIIRRSTSSIPSQRYATVGHFVQAINYRHCPNVILLMMIVLATLTIIGLGAWTYARQDVKQHVQTAVPKMKVTAAEVASQTMKPITNGVETIQQRNIKRQTSYPRSGAFSGDKDVNLNF